MSLLNNAVSVSFFHAVFRLTSRCRFVGREHLPPRGTPYILAIAHLSHYDPVAAGALVRRQLDFMARAEFYATPASRWFVESAGCVRIDRYGPALPGVREALRRLAKRRPIAIFPEGEIMAGANSVLNGGAVKGGAGLLSRKSGAVVVPCVVLGASQFSRVLPWLPLRTGRLWIGLGEPLAPAVDATPGRAARQAAANDLAEAIRKLDRHMQERFEIPAEVRP